MLDAAGVGFEVETPRVDEEKAKQNLRAAGLSPRDQAARLAELKALSVSRGRFVIGADQILAMDGETFDKPADLEQARAHLQQLRGREHTLITAAVVACDGEIVWRHVEIPRLTMRAFSDAFLDAYLARAGEGALSSVGAYQIEGFGAHLFERVEGDYFSILGLPLLPLLAFLRENGALPK